MCVCVYERQFLYLHERALLQKTNEAHAAKRYEINEMPFSSLLLLFIIYCAYWISLFFVAKREDEKWLLCDPRNFSPTLNSGVVMLCVNNIMKRHVCVEAIGSRQPLNHCGKPKILKIAELTRWLNVIPFHSSSFSRLVELYGGAHTTQKNASEKKEVKKKLFKRKVNKRVCYFLPNIPSD